MIPPSPAYPCGPRPDGFGGSRDQRATNRCYRPAPISLPRLGERSFCNETAAGGSAPTRLTERASPPDGRTSRSRQRRATAQAACAPVRPAGASTRRDGRARPRGGDGRGRRGPNPRPRREAAPLYAATRLDRKRLPDAQNRHCKSAAFVIPIRLSMSTGTPRQLAGGSEITIGPRSRSAPLSSSSTPSAWVSFPGPEHRFSRALHAAARPHRVDPFERLERPDQHRCPHPFGLGHRVQQRVDPIGAVHVCLARRPEQRPGARRQADERVTGRLGIVVGLGLDDHPRAAVVGDDATDQLARHLEHGALIEGTVHRSAFRARSSCSRTRSRLVPPSDTFDSSHARSESSA